MPTRLVQISLTTLISILLLIAVFPDVIIGGSSLRITDQINGSRSQGGPTKPFPVPDHTEWWSSQADTGGAAFQSEPIAEFVKTSLWQSESLYWNPFSGTGALGPEALVDLKLSFFTLVYAISGGGSLAYNVIYLGAYFVGLIALHGCARRLEMSRFATAGVGIFFLANGYVSASMGSNTALSYPYWPMLLYAAFAVCDRQRPQTVALLALCLAILLSFTFLPTTITTILAVAVVASAHFLTVVKNAPDRLRLSRRIVACIAIAAALSLLVVAPIYVPLLENLGNSGTLEDYQKRLFYGLYFPHALPSFISPSLFFESFNAMEPRARAFHFGYRSYPGNTVYSLGVVAVLLAAGSVRLKKTRQNFVALVCIALIFFTLIRLFNPDWFELLITRIPVISNIAYQYWWPCIVIPFTFLVGYGLDSIRTSSFNIVAASITLSGMVIAVAYVWNDYGLIEPHISYKALMVCIVAAFASLFFVVAIAIKEAPPRFRNVACSAIIALLFCELAMNAKAVRFPRNDVVSSLPEAVQFVKDRVGLYRTLNFGQTGLYPELGSAIGVQETSSMNPGGMPAYLDFFYEAVDLDISQRMGVGPSYPRGAFPSLIAVRDTPDKNKFDIEKLRVLGVKYILIPADFSNFREWFTNHGFKVAFESPATTVLENLVLLPRAFQIALTPATGSLDVEMSTDLSAAVPAKITSYRNTSVEIEGVASDAGFVVLTDAWHPFWAASVNGKSFEPVFRVSKTFRGISVPKGPYTIKLEYRLPSLSFALLMFCVGVFLTILLLVTPEQLWYKFVKKNG